ncbi:hypothetical protein NG798_08820 [Ancylothrix sp. C2]|uniref:hypothetical protein n=1 Tax=Ancylothrix sp. D3o TaxID=2953691 RepID=UPI0021BB6E47|nr:hypothetical protein [Ancylothrix sp. D3o]MCT7949887.1 hypothetical protein [Ancylothrix sp. D3o]
MAKLPAETSETIWTLLRQLLTIVEDAGAAEYTLFERYGETPSTLGNLADLKKLAEEAATRYSQLFKIRLRIAEANPTAPNDMLRLVDTAITQNQLRIPAMERSIQEIKTEWNLQ